MRLTRDEMQEQTKDMAIKDKLLSVGIGGTIVAALCCFTPILVWVLGGLGLSGFLGYLYRDDVLFPVLALFLVITGYALWRRRRTK